MDLILYPKKLQGTVKAIPSKSQAHRLLISAALADAPTTLLCGQTNKDMEATAACLRALGARITYDDGAYRVDPIRDLPKSASLPCGESGSTLRFLLPLAGALGVDATFCLEGRLGKRPLSPLWEEMERMGCTLSRPAENTVRCTGKLCAGDYYIDGNISSQFITGLLFACSVLPGESRIHVKGKLESQPYVTMTQDALAAFGVKTEALTIKTASYKTPGKLAVEGDWSNAAFFLAAGAMGSEVTLTGLADSSSQGDRACVALLKALCRENTTVAAEDIPDLVPILSVVAAACHGARFTGVHRLRLKESDRIATTIAMLEALGGSACADNNTLTVSGGCLTGGKVNAAGDHRIAMSAAIASTVCQAPVVILGAECVEKSYPGFWEAFKNLGGSYAEYIR